jgi:hypothetical protein
MKILCKYNAASKRYIWRETKSIGQLENAHMPNKVTNKKQVPFNQIPVITESSMCEVRIYRMKTFKQNFLKVENLNLPWPLFRPDLPMHVHKKPINLVTPYL